MGLLDDAIREHLELKRRHGADPDEVSRQEREALGAPVRGEFAKPAGDAAPAEAEGDVEVAEAPPVEDEVEAPPVRDDDELDVPEADFLGERREREPAPPFDAEEPEPAAKEPRPGTEEDPWLVEDLADEEEEPEPPARPDAPPPPKADSPEGEDVLEETPEFLQETPEHDRLWFEQKPPRDFDWDK